MSGLLRMALEETSDGIAFKEIEYEYYGKLLNLDELKSKATSKETQEQWEVDVPKKLDNAGRGRIRIRKTTTNDGKVEYVITTKSLLIKDNARIEVAVPTTEDNFKQFKILASKGMHKDRYCIPVDGLVFEYDLFIKPDGTYHDWVKVDLEVKNKDVPVPDLPIMLDDIIVNQKYARTDEEIRIIDTLYKTMFINKNEYL